MTASRPLLTFTPLLPGPFFDDVAGISRLGMLRPSQPAKYGTQT